MNIAIHPSIVIALSDSVEANIEAVATIKPRKRLKVIATTSVLKSAGIIKPYVTDADDTIWVMVYDREAFGGWAPNTRLNRTAAEAAVNNRGVVQVELDGITLFNSGNSLSRAEHFTGMNAVAVVSEPQRAELVIDVPAGHTLALADCGKVQCEIAATRAVIKGRTCLLNDPSGFEFDSVMELDVCLGDSWNAMIDTDTGGVQIHTLSPDGALSPMITHIRNGHGDGIYQIKGEGNCIHSFKY